MDFGAAPIVDDATGESRVVIGTRGARRPQIPGPDSSRARLYRQAGLIGWFANKVYSVSKGVLFGPGAGRLLRVSHRGHAAARRHALQVMLPGSVLGMIVGYARQRYGGTAARPA